LLPHTRAMVASHTSGADSSPKQRSKPRPGMARYAFPDAASFRRSCRTPAWVSALAFPSTVNVNHLSIFLEHHHEVSSIVRRVHVSCGSISVISDRAIVVRYSLISGLSSDVAALLEVLLPEVRDLFDTSSASVSSVGVGVPAYRIRPQPQDGDDIIAYPCVWGLGRQQSSHRLARRD
jgi:hypothetical protein